MYVGDLSDETLEYLNYLYDSIMCSSDRYVSIIKKYVEKYFGKDEFIKDKYIILKSTYNNCDDEIFFSVNLYLEDFNELIENKETKYPKKDEYDYQYTNNTFIFYFTDDFNKSLEETGLYTYFEDSESEKKYQKEWDKFEKYMIDNAHKEIYDLYIKDFETYVLPNIVNEIKEKN